MNTGEFEQSKLFSLMALSKEMFENQEKDEKIQHLESRIKELETTIENMKAIAGEKIEYVGTKTSVDYIDDNTTELITEREDIFGVGYLEITKTKCCGIAQITKENYCPNCGRKIKK